MQKAFFLAAATVIVQLLTGCASDRPADITLDVLEEKMSQAMDPAREYRRAGSYFQRQNIEEETFWGGKKYQLVEVRFERPDKFKFSYYDAKNKAVTEILSSGSQAWTVNHTQGVIKKLDGNALDKFKVMLALSHPDTDYDKLFARVDIFITTLEDEREYYKLVCYPALENANPITIYVDRIDFLPKRMTLNVRTASGTVKSTSTIEQYNLFGKVKLPSLTRVDEQTRQYYTRLIDYQLNYRFSKDEFKLPEFDPVLMEMQRQKQRRK
ncbi:MAG: hypothetical protein J6S19_02870 [Lentisphaeria bacterium]|nr:hypothetical protein [Lentisphaeria bacterium]